MLLGRRSDHETFYPSAWDVIGGHVEGSESLSEALVREFVEEIDVKPLEFVELASLSEPRPTVNGEAEYHIYAITRWEGVPTLRGTEHSEVRWFDVPDAVQLELAHPGYVSLFNGLRLGL